MAVNKVEYGGTVLIDLTDSNVQADKLAQGYTAYDRRGVKIDGTAIIGQSLPLAEYIHAYVARGDGDFYQEGNYVCFFNTIDTDPSHGCIGDDDEFKIDHTTNVGAYADVGIFGTATPSDVVRGKTFTSVSGLLSEGELDVQKYYTGSTTPSASLGNNGDLYLKV